MRVWVRVTLTASEGEYSVFDRAEDPEDHAEGRHGWRDSWVEGSPASPPSQSKGLCILSEKISGDTVCQIWLRIVTVCYGLDTTRPKPPKRKRQASDVPVAPTKAPTLTLASNMNKWGSHFFLLAPTSPTPRVSEWGSTCHHPRGPLPRPKSELEGSLFSCCHHHLFALRAPCPWPLHAMSTPPACCISPAPVCWVNAPARCISALAPARCVDARASARCVSAPAPVNCVDTSPV